MINRTVKVLGWGTGSSPATITANLDGIQVFSGTVSLIGMTMDNESEQTAPTLFTFEIPMDFVGTKKMSISVKGAPVRFGQIVVNYSEIEMSGLSYSSGQDIYHDIVEENDKGIRDPRSNVTIDGQSCSADRSLGRGTWHWTVDPGSIFEHDLTVSCLGLVE